jgi:hypothetical protein
MKHFFCRSQIPYNQLSNEDKQCAALKAEIKQLKKEHKLLSSVSSTYNYEHAYSPYLPTETLYYCFFVNDAKKTMQ